MKKFITKIAETVINTDLNGLHSVVVLPNRRSIIFIKDELKKINRSNIWLPEFIPFDELMYKLSGITKADNISLSFTLYDVYSKIEGNNSSSVEEFLNWASIIISDFNDIDGSLAGASEIYHELSAIKAIQEWNPDGKPLTGLQKNYISFFNSMYNYYVKFNKTLKEKNIGYYGMVCRYLAENNKIIRENNKWTNFLFAGLNALSEAELQTIAYIKSNYNTDFIWDIDEYYYSVDSKPVIQKEAGKNIKNIIDRLKISNPFEIERNLTESKKNVRIIGVPRNVGQAKFIGQELEHSKNNISGNEGSTAIVLANEGLLIQLLCSLPELSDESNSSAYNLTLGYPLKNSQVEDLFNSWIDIIISLRDNKNVIATRDLLHFLNINILKKLIDVKGSDIENITQHIIKNNLLEISLSDIIDLIPKREVQSSSFISKLFLTSGLSDDIKVLAGLKEVLLAGIEKTNYSNIILREQLQATINIISRLILLTRRNRQDINLNVIKKVGNKLINQSRINLKGEPLTGIQIMGMLETRALDFDNIYILSANEGILPAETKIDSLIPFDIRREFGLPLPSRTSEIYSYHFYRLLQRAQNITMLYNSDTDNFGGGEKSRFILQLENELQKVNPIINLTKQIVNSDISLSQILSRNDIDLEVAKSNEILYKLSAITETGLSASLINTYISCHLKFYLSYLLKINTNTEIKQSVEANTFGTAIHEALEYIYKPFTGKEIDSSQLKKSLGSVREILTDKFKIHYSNKELYSGKNMLIFEVACNYLKNFLKWDIVNTKEYPTILISTESKLTVTLPIDGENINYKGIIDRIDKRIIDDNFRIIDYKTGKVSKTDLTLKNTEELFSDSKYAKAFQVIYYAWLANKNYPTEKLESGIVSIRNISNGFIPVLLKQHNDISEFFTEFEENIIKITSDILNKETTFTKTQDKNQCTWCDYKSVCNR